MEPVRNEELRTRLLECAAKHFADGYAAANMTAICQDAGVSRGPLYYYFKSKPELYLATTRYLIEQQTKASEAVLAQNKTLPELLYDDVSFWLRQNWRFFCQHTSVPEFREEIEALNTAFERTVYEGKRKLFTEAQARGELSKDCKIDELIAQLYHFYYGHVYMEEKARNLPELIHFDTERDIQEFIAWITEKYLKQE